MAVFGDCAACRAKDQVIDQLQALLENAHKTMLVAVDARAYAVRYAAERARPVQPADGSAGTPPLPHSSPARLRAMSPVGDVPETLTTEQLEERFRGTGIP